MTPRRSRGSAMLLTLMVVVGLLLLSVGILVFSGHQTAQAAAMREHQQLTNCALAVRQYIGSQLRFPSAPAITSISFTIPGSSGTALKIDGKHYTEGSTMTVSGFQLGSGTSGGIATTIEEMGNNVKLNSAGSMMTGTAVCTDATNREYEVEFSFAFGI